jgi:septum site-determining protein MinD
LLDSKTEKAERDDPMPKHLLITRFDSARAASSEMLAIADVLEILSIPLLGIVPESEDVLRASNIGSPITTFDEQSAAARAYTDAAKRLSGESVAMTIPSNKEGSA